MLLELREDRQDNSILLLVVEVSVNFPVHLSIIPSNFRRKPIIIIFKFFCSIGCITIIYYFTQFSRHRVKNILKKEYGDWNKKQSKKNYV